MNEYTSHPYEEYIPENATKLILGTIPPYRFCIRQGLHADDVDFYYDILNDYDVDKHSKLLQWQNEPSLIALIAWSFKQDINLDEWIKEYFSKNNMYFINQKKNYLHMKNNLDEYLQLHTRQAF